MSNSLAHPWPIHRTPVLLTVIVSSILCACGGRAETIHMYEGEPRPAEQTTVLTYEKLGISLSQDILVPFLVTIDGEPGPIDHTEQGFGFLYNCRYDATFEIVLMPGRHTLVFDVWNATQDTYVAKGIVMEMDMQAGRRYMVNVDRDTMTLSITP